MWSKHYRKNIKAKIKYSMKTRSKFKISILIYIIFCALNMKWAEHAYREGTIILFILYSVFALIFIAEALFSSYILIYILPKSDNSGTSSA